MSSASSAPLSYASRALIAASLALLRWSIATTSTVPAEDLPAEVLDGHLGRLDRARAGERRVDAGHVGDDGDLDGAFGRRRRRRDERRAEHRDGEQCRKGTRNTHRTDLVGGARVDRTLRAAVGVPPGGRTNRGLAGNDRTTMSKPIEDYALIGDTRTAALVSRDGSIDWLCLPRFDSGACFAALVGDEENGTWSLAPQGHATAITRAYREDSMVLETVYELEGGGRVRVVDAMLAGSETPRLLRLVTGEAGRVAMRSEMRIRFDYGQIVPWIHRSSGTVVAVAGPDALALYSDVELRGQDLSTVAEFWVGPGERVGFEMAYFPSYEQQPGPSDVVTALRRTDVFWREWARTCRYDGPVARRRGPLAAHAQGADRRAHRRGARGADDVAARTARRRAQLGLPLLLAARRDVRARRAAERGL